MTLILITGVAYFFSSPERNSPYDYTLRLAEALLSGKLGLPEAPPAWLNEVVEMDGLYYAGFPLGSVLCMVPFALLRQFSLWVYLTYSSFIMALIVSAVVFLLYLISCHYKLRSRVLARLVLLPLFGSWMWANLAFGGTWQINLAWAILGQLGAIYFAVFSPRPLLAGFFFALAFGNRTEIIILGPVFLYLLDRNWRKEALGDRIFKDLKFCAVPFFLLVLTLLYNDARFGSPTDFGSSHLPGVLSEPWYQHGIFSSTAIPRNMLAMLFEGLKPLNRFPYFGPSGFGGSIFLSCPFLFLLFRDGSVNPIRKRISWIAIGIVTLLLWCHGNPGGWQISYRYATDLWPWFFLILLETTPKKGSINEAVLFFVSVVINAFSTYLFLWAPGAL